MASIPASMAGASTCSLPNRMAVAISRSAIPERACKLGSPGLGMDWGSLRERLALMFGDTAALRISELAAHGFRVSIDCPAWP